MALWVYSFCSEWGVFSPDEVGRILTLTEAKLVAAFCRYLVRGPPRYGQDKITVLATYVAQVGSLRRKLQSDGLGDVRVSPVAPSPAGWRRAVRWGAAPCGE